MHCLLPLVARLQVSHICSPVQLSDSMSTQSCIHTVIALYLHQMAVALESGDDHWQKSLEAAQAARKQAQIVEAESAATHQKYLAAQDATRNFEKARREHMAIQVRLGICLRVHARLQGHEQSYISFWTAQCCCAGSA